MDNNIYYVYAYLRNENNLPYYIGKGKGNRMYHKHHNKLPVPKDKSKIIILIDNLSEEDALTIESIFIFLLGRKCEGNGILYNISLGGEGPSGMKHSEESRKKMSKTRTGKKRKPHSEETKEKIRQANTGRKMKPEDLLKMSESHKGLKQSEETIQKRVEKLKGQKRSEDFVKTITAEGNPAYGRKWINNGIINLFVTQEELESDYSDWSLGVINKNTEHYPSNEDLQKLLWEKPVRQIIKELNTTVKIFNNHIKKHNLSKPVKGYWNNPKNHLLGIENRNPPSELPI